MPVLMIATYGDNDKVDVMNMAWGGICDNDKVAKIQNDEFGFRVVGEIVNVLADENVLDESGKVDPTKLNAFVFDQFQNGYYKIGEKVGQAWNSGMKYMNK